MQNTSANSRPVVMDPELEKYFMPDTVSRPHPFKHSAPIADDELYDPKKLIENIERLSVIRESLEEDKKVDKERIRQRTREIMELEKKYKDTQLILHERTARFCQLEKAYINAVNQLSFEQNARQQEFSMRCHLETIITKLEKEKEESDFKIKELEMKVKAAETLSLQEAEDAAALDAAALAQQEKEEAKVNESTHEQSNIVAEETNAAVKRIQIVRTDVNVKRNSQQSFFLTEITRFHNDGCERAVDCPISSTILAANTSLLTSHSNESHASNQPIYYSMSEYFDERNPSFVPESMFMFPAKPTTDAGLFHLRQGSHNKQLNKLIASPRQQNLFGKLFTKIKSLKR